MFAFSIASLNARSFCHNCSRFVTSELEMISVRDLGSFIVAQDDSHLLGSQAPVVTMSSDWSQWPCAGLSLARAGSLLITRPHAMETVSRLCLTHNDKH